MLQVIDNQVQESLLTLTNTASGIGGSLLTSQNSYYQPSVTVQPYTYWYNYPVYICTDKTKKAIDILKALQADKQIECKSVTKFIELVEKIANLL